MIAGLRRAAEKDHRAALVQRTQATGSHGAATSAQARILALQRQAGNRAVTALLRGQVQPSLQREISWKPEDLEVGRSWKDRLRTTFASDTYSLIIEAVKDFHAARDAKTKMYLARVIEWRSEDWLTRHGDRASGKAATQKRMLENLHAEADREVSKLKAEALYLRDMQSEAGLLEGGPGSFKGMYQPAKQTGAYAGKAMALAGGGAPGGPGADDRAAEIVQKYKLSAAEVAAIRTFTLPDYAYINPATANADEWLKSNVKGSDNLKQHGALPAIGKDALGPGLKLLKLEGALHAGMLNQALAKLPRFAEVAYRGRRMSPADFATKYNGGQGGLEKFGAFSSTTKSMGIARGYADGTGGDVTTNATDTVSVVYEITMKDGRDISLLSAAISKNEEEVLILPGAELKVDAVIPESTGNAGKPSATAWYKIKMTQVK